EFHALAEQLGRVISRARTIGLMARSAAAQALWETQYPHLTRACPGLLGKATSRAEAQVVRLSILYALLDGTNMIDVPHLRAAIAVWPRCFDSARLRFGDVL